MSQEGPRSLSPEMILATDQEAFNRLERLLVAMRQGEQLRAADAADASGLSEHVCRHVLLGLERAGLMAQEATDLFVRRSL
jgi:hypothetical protein